MSVLTLSPEFQIVAFKLQEAYSHSDIRTHLNAALSESLPKDSYGYVHDVYGDDQSGDVVYSHNGTMQQAGYNIATVNGKPSASIDHENAVKVTPRTVYDQVADDSDHYTAMESAKLTAPGYIERFISKNERSKAGGDDFAGKGKSFPILKPEDVMAAVHSMGRAGSGNLGASGIKARIIAIAKRKGWESYLPKEWQSDSAKESAAVVGGPLKLIESAATLETIVLREAKADYEIKLIAPGKGSSAFYPKEVLQRDGPNVFKAGTHVYLNHPTAAEESDRPEGDVKNLAGVLTTAAAYHESHAKGPGLYARMKVFADHGQMVEEKAAHVGMSIRASGEREAKTMQEGLPVLKKLTSAESVDVVTRAGAGGMILTESASTEPHEEVSDMDAQALTKLQESLTAGLNTLALREARMDAKEKANKAIESLRLPPEAKQEIVTRCMENIPMKDGILDETKFKESLDEEIKRIGRLVSSLSGGGRVIGMGTSAVGIREGETPETRRLRETQEREDNVRLRESEESIFADLMGNKNAAKFAASRGEAA